VLASFRLEAERIYGCSGERQFAEIYLGSKSIVEILDDKIQNVFRHIMMNLSPKIAGILTTLTKYRRDNEAV